MTNVKKQLPKISPSCGEMLRVSAMHCIGCDTRIEGEYELPALMQLSADDLAFVSEFVLCGGSLKALAQRVGLSYPSVRNRLDDIIARLEQSGEQCVDNNK